MERYICIHGHFYQPPRENPWLEDVELQDSAYPYHDWNARITAECYSPNAASRILGEDKKIIDIVNNYSKISFNFGPTLLSWMQRHAPQVYNDILGADKKSLENFGGHGAAMAQVYNHMIMPLANSRDKRTQVIWGIRDFRHRFDRDPQGMWLAETAVDLETLEIMAEHNLKFTVLAPHQALKVRKITDKQWVDVSGGKIDPKVPYLCKLPSGRTISLFFYDGAISRETAFGGLLDNGENFANKLLAAFLSENHSDQLEHIATDGETYGHHHRFGDMALTYCLYFLESNNLARITIYSEFLEKNPPQYEVEIIENSSWSCFHGVERWRANCGCNSNGHAGWNQDWRAPLRGAMDWLRDNLVHIFEEQLSGLVKDPWKARDEYIEVILDRSQENVENFLSRITEKDTNYEEKLKILYLMEMQRNAMLMYTSCGWFFDEISGIETLQVLNYAARAMQLAKAVSNVSLEEVYRGLLERAPSNIPEFENGAKVYDLFVKPLIMDLSRVGVHYGITSLFKKYPSSVTLYSFSAERRAQEQLEAGKQKLIIGRVFLRSNITWNEEEVIFAALHLGDHNIVAAAKPYAQEESFNEMLKQMKESFQKGEISDLIRHIDTNFNGHTFSLSILLKDEQKQIIDQIFAAAQKEIGGSLRSIYEHHYAAVQFMSGLNIPLPKYFSAIIGFVLNTDIQRILDNEGFDNEKLSRLIKESKKWYGEIDIAALELKAARKVDLEMERLSQDIQNIGLMKNISELVSILRGLSQSINFWKAQNIHFYLSKAPMHEMQERSQAGDALAGSWLDSFTELGEALSIKVK